MFYAQINQNGIVTAVTETTSEIVDEHMVPIDSFDMSVMGMRYVDGQFVDAPPPPQWVITRNALQARFPLTANGVSTKYDLATLFLNDAGYAASLGVTGADLYSQRALLITANNRLGVVTSVNLQAQETIDYITMMQNPVFPEVFRLTQAEADVILNTPAAPNETP